MKEKENVIRILHFIPGFIYGGIESLFLMWYKNIDNSTFEMDLLLRTQDDSAASLVEYKNMGGNYYRLYPLSPNKMHLYIMGVKKFFELHHDYDILHAHGEDPFVFYYAHKYGIKNIILHFHTTSNGNGKEKYSLIKKGLSKISKLYPNHYFACSKLVAKSMYGSKKATIVTNSIEVDRFKFKNENREKYRKIFNIENKLVIGHVGRFTYAKNHIFLLHIFAEICKKNNNSVLILVGDGPILNNIIEVSKELNINDHVLFLGSHSDVNELLNAMDIFLFPSLWEGLPVTIIEAQTAGLPCIISDTIPDEVCITDLVHFVSLSETALQWADIVLSTKINILREQYSEIVKDSDYNISNSIAILENEYFRIARN